MKYIFLNSGGLDSLAVAILMKNKGHELYSLHIDANMKNKVSAGIASQKIADMYCISHKIVTVSGFEPTSTNNRMGLPHMLPAYHYLAACYAGLSDIDLIVCGHKGEDPSYEKAIDAIFGASSTPTPSYRKNKTKGLYRPLANLTTDFNQLYLIVKDSPLLHDTVSCFEETPCGTCFKCLQRQQYNI